MKELTIVIPVRQGGSPEVTLKSLGKQTYLDFDVVIIWDEDGNANRARNRGFEMVQTPLVLFSDDDIEWEPTGIESLVSALNKAPSASYSYGAFEMEGRIQCDVAFDSARLQRRNYISTMSAIRSQDFPGFDENLRRLQDWDLWLTMLKQGKRGVYAGYMVFRTKRRDGITYGGATSYSEAERIVKEKHRITV